MGSNMKIEKISKYIPIASSSRSSADTATIRHMLVSLPRVRWLEREDISDLNIRNYSMEGSAVELSNMGSYITLTGRERELSNMSKEGMSLQMIAQRKNMNSSNVARILDSAQKKLAMREALKDDDSDH